MILLVILLYFGLLLLVARLAGKGSNDSFFRGGRRSPWPVVAFGMVGASISGVTFVSVPGMIRGIDMTYLQMCMGFIVGYLVVAFVLMPLYYRHNLTSIYSYLGTRFGNVSRKTGAWFFLLSKMAGAAAKLYLACLILQSLPLVSFAGETRVLQGDGAFVVIVLVTLLFIWLYTRRSGIQALVWTDFVQTACLLGALVLILVRAADMLDMNAGEALSAVWHDPHARIFEFADWTSRQHFLKQFLSGVFVVIVMTGLDQDMMQKNLTCRTLADSQKDLCSYGVLFLPVNFLFLALGILLLMLYTQLGIDVPTRGDDLLPTLVIGGQMGQTALVLFAIGIIASAFSSADSALTALTTSFCIDILGMDNRGGTTLRKRVHLGMVLAFLFAVLTFKAFGSDSVIDAVYIIAGYTYGPLLGLFAFGMTTRLMPRERLVPLVAIASPLACYAIDRLAFNLSGYRFGYELLMLNGLLTYTLLLCISRRR